MNKVIAYLQIFSLLLLVAVMPYYPGALQSITMGAAGFFFILDYVVNRRWADWTWGRDKWLYIAMIAYYLCIPLWHIGSESTNWVLGYALEQRLPFVVCGVVGFAGLSKDFELRYACYAMIAAALAASVYVIWNAGGLQFFSYPRELQVHMFSQSRIEEVRDHMIFNLYMNVTLVFAFYLITNKLEKPLIRAVATAASLWIFYVLSLSEGRVGFATGIALFGTMFCILIYTRRGWKYIVPTATVLAALFVIAAASLLYNHERLSSENLEREPRWDLWRIGTEVVRENPVVGYGVCDAREMFVGKVIADEHLEVYRQHVKSIRDGDMMRAHPHSTYLEAWAEFGILGLALVFFIFIYPLTMLPKANRLFVLFVVGIFMIQLVFDKFLIPLLYCLSIIFLTSRSAISEAERKKML